MLTALWCFMKDYAAKTSLFSVFTFATVYFAPIGWGMKAIVAYCGCGVIFWLVPWLWAKLSKTDPSS